MAGSGPAPKPDAQRRRRNTPTHGAERVVLDDGTLRGPELSDVCPVIPTDDAIRHAVLLWWDTWRRSPQSAVFTSTDWQRLGMIAPLVSAYWTEPTTAIMAEIRLNEERLGATHTDRLKARIRVETATDADVIPLHGESDADILSLLQGGAGE